MRTQRVTVTIPVEDVERLRSVVEAAGGSLSGYVADAVRARLDRDIALARLRELWGEQEYPPEAKAWARRALGLDDADAGSARQAS